ncbi:MAG: endolytic transglycosylase MltG [Wenzhouxiangella sp.]
MRILLFLLLVSSAVVALLGARAWTEWQEFRAAPLNPDADMVLWVAPGASLNSVVRDLERLGLARASWHWRVLGHQHGGAIRAGEYLVPTGLNPVQLMDHLTRGRVRQHRFTIVEGWTLNRLRRQLADDPRLVHATAGWSNEELMAYLGCAECFAQGRFLPETYFFERGSSDLDLLRRAHLAMNSLLEEVWAQRHADLPLSSADQLLILASIIERETGQAGERTQVAGVFARRLQLGMRLQTDPTVIYGLGEDFDGRLRRVHLRTDHPWNTYTRHGLPPTPIALPGSDSIRAAAQPAAGTALFFVARGDGTHQFSDTYEQHNAAIDRYIRRRR